ncbi:flagellar basal-body MS-ring/collar protein FliF [Paraburkholderia sp. IW21]|uniref:flagellar basal-body MS-ring/collar protein FliF n=1 Tax=Paraburkholderia sp. IW21 TaxID=3242488 RepID=UPI00352051B2
MNSTLSRLTAFASEGSRPRQFAIVAALVVVIGGAAAAGWLLLRPSYQVLFRDLKRQDASTIATELEKQKIPYRYDDQTSSILVPEGDARATRLKLMSGDLRLQGVVGLELFNNSDLGLTDFAQKVNYQRALQGELARTIMTLDEIELARVHLTLPESSLFRRDSARPKASVALFLRDGQTLRPETITGIQRLVAAAVPELSPVDVSVLDQRGAPANGRAIELDEPGLRLKDAIERSYEQKIAAQIERVIGPGHASVSVDASINLDRVHTTRESDVSRPIVTDSNVASTAGNAWPPLPKQSTPTAGLPPLPTAAMPAVRSPEGTRTEHNIEQIVREPGALRRLSVGIVFDKPLPPAELANLNSVISASVGLDPARGDVLSAFVQGSQAAGAAASAVQGVAQPVSLEPSPSTHERSGSELAFSADATATGQLHPASGASVSPPTGSTSVFARTWIVAAALIALAVVVLAGLVAWTTRRARASRQQRLTQAQRDQHVVRLRTLLAQQDATHEAP